MIKKRQDSSTAIEDEINVYIPEFLELAVNAGFALAYIDSGQPVTKTQSRVTKDVLEAQLRESLESDISVDSDTVEIEIANRQKLTPRESEVIRMKVEGFAIRYISAKLDLSVRTVEGHLYQAYSKLGITDSHELNGNISGHPKY